MVAGVVELDAPRDPRAVTIESEVIAANRALLKGNYPKLDTHLARALALVRGRDDQHRDHALREHVDAQHHRERAPA